MQKMLQNSLKNKYIIDIQYIFYSKYKFKIFNQKICQLSLKSDESRAALAI